MQESSAWLATRLDIEMLPKVHGPEVSEDDLDLRRGSEVSTELGGRLLLRYVLARQAHEFETDHKIWTTPTAYAPSDIRHYLAMPRPDLPRQHVLLLDPREIDWIQGPRWVAMGSGIEYILPHGYPRSAVAPPGWAVEVQ